MAKNAASPGGRRPRWTVQTLHCAFLCLMSSPRFDDAMSFEHDELLCGGSNAVLHSDFVCEPFFFFTNEEQLMMNNNEGGGAEVFVRPGPFFFPARRRAGRRRVLFAWLSPLVASGSAQHGPPGPQR